MLFRANVDKWTEHLVITDPVMASHQLEVTECSVELLLQISDSHTVFLSMDKESWL